ncbi:MAG: hypothetical protein HY314_11840 [Acidobacteria bacterium]|nr:hypothetical protein [Acidobacteriota bacterium]
MQRCRGAGVKRSRRHPLTLSPLHVFTAWVLLYSSWVLLFGCGKVGDPLPPAPRLPLRTRDLALTQRGPFILLRWPNPNVETLESLGFSLRRIDVYRLIQPLSAPETVSEEEFAERAALIGSVDERQIRATPASEEFVFRDGPLSQLNRRYYYAVRYVSTRGQSAALSNIAPIIPSPRVAAAPKNLQARDQAQDVIALTWNPPEANIDGSTPPVVLGDNVYRRTQDQSQFGLPINGATPVTTLEFFDRKFQYGTEYVYTVRAISRGNAGEVVESADADPVAHTPRDTFPPAAPEGLTAGSANAVISLFWTANSEPDLAGYNIYRAERADASESEWVKLNAELHILTTFRDETSIRGKTYYYKVTAIDRAGNVSPASAIVEQEAQ